MAAFGTADPGEPFAQVAALQILVDRLPNDRSPKPVLMLEAFGVDALEALVMLLHEAIQGRVPRLARAIESGIVVSWAVHSISQQEGQIRQHNSLDMAVYE